MREIVIKIDCGEKTCKDCFLVFGESHDPFCGYFNSAADDDLTPYEGTYLRLPNCLEAEKKMKELIGGNDDR